MNRSLPPFEFGFLSTLESIESESIKVGRFDDWVDLSTVAKKLGLDYENTKTTALQLFNKGELIFDRSTGKDLVKSKTANVIKNLYHLTTRVQRRDVRDVSDLKYIRFIKQIPKQNVPLSDAEIKNSIIKNLGCRTLQEEKIIRAALEAIGSTFENISDFQKDAIQTIVTRLANKEKKRSLVVQAETGAGKSLAYQVPLILWVLLKKSRAYFSSRKMKPTSSPTAILLFPRNVLAKDQFDSLTELMGGVNRSLEKLTLPSEFIRYLRVNVVNDFGGTPFLEKVKIYGNNPDIIISNPDTLKRRLMDSVSAPVIASGVELVLYDEVHLYYGLFGAHVASLNSRLQSVLPAEPVFVGMSATIANPQKHCKKLFALTEDPDLISDQGGILEDFALEHHVILKPRPGRNPLGVCVDATSCLLHNRRGDTRQSHRINDPEMRPKSLCFVDSLDIAGRWAADQRNYEYFDDGMRTVRTIFKRGYPVHFAPLADQSSGRVSRDVCLACKSRRDTIAANCPMFLNGSCWWFSRDSAEPGRWITSAAGLIPDDHIRAKRVTRQEINLSEIDDIYSLFRNPGEPFDHDLPVDALIASPVLEVGVDFRGVKEIVQYGEIRSPATYKQKAGRGAREGNLGDGLFILCTISYTPLANFYYRHFQRLVSPSLSPLPLEPRNPDILRSHAVCSVFDFLAKEGPDVFNIIIAKEDANIVEREFRQAIEFLTNNRRRVLDHVSRYLLRLGEGRSEASAIADEATNVAFNVMQQLTSEFQVADNKKTLVRWIFEAFRSQDVMRELEDEFGESLERRGSEIRLITDSQVSLNRAISKILEVTERLPAEYAEDVSRLRDLATDLKVDT